MIPHHFVDFVILEPIPLTPRGGFVPSLPCPVTVLLVDAFTLDVVGRTIGTASGASVGQKVGSDLMGDNVLAAITGIGVGGDTGNCGAKVGDATGTATLLLSMQAPLASNPTQTPTNRLVHAVRAFQISGTDRYLLHCHPQEALDLLCIGIISRVYHCIAGIVTSPRLPRESFSMS
jgi:hypothetical protein